MQKSYEGLKDMLTYIGRQHRHRDTFKLGAGKNIPKKYIVPKAMIIVGYDDIGVVKTFLDSQEIQHIYIIENFTDEQAMELKYTFEDKVRLLASTEMFDVFRRAWEVLDFVYINTPATKQFEEIVKIYPYPKFWIGGSNFDYRVHPNIFKHSKSLKLKFKDNHWTFFCEQWAWYWEGNLRKPYTNKWDKTIAKNKQLNGTTTLQKGKLYKMYHQDLRVHTNMDGDTPFIDYYDGMPLYDKLPIPPPKILEDYHMNYVSQTPLSSSPFSSETGEVLHQDDVRDIEVDNKWNTIKKEDDWWSDIKEINKEMGEKSWVDSDTSRFYLDLEKRSKRS